MAGSLGRRARESRQENFGILPNGDQTRLRRSVNDCRVGHLQQRIWHFGSFIHHTETWVISELLRHFFIIGHSSSWTEKLIGFGGYSLISSLFCLLSTVYCTVLSYSGVYIGFYTTWRISLTTYLSSPDSCNYVVRQFLFGCYALWLSRILVQKARTFTV